MDTALSFCILRVVGVLVLRAIPCPEIRFDLFKSAAAAEASGSSAEVAPSPLRSLATAAGSENCTTVADGGARSLEVVAEEFGLLLLCVIDCDVDGAGQVVVAAVVAMLRTSSGTNGVQGTCCMSDNTRGLSFCKGNVVDTGAVSVCSPLSGVVSGTIATGTEAVVSIEAGGAEVWLSALLVDD